MKILLWIIGMALTTSCFAIINPNIYVFHINGVNTELEEAKFNAAQLQKFSKISSNLLINDGYFDILYNKKDPNSFCSLCHQLAEVLKQKENEDVTLDDFVIAWMRDNPEENYPIGSPEYYELRNNIKDRYYTDPTFMGENLQDIADQFYDKAPDLDEFKYVTEYMGIKFYDTQKPMVLLIPHSQGNLYANRLFDYLTQHESYPLFHISILGFANPADHVSGYGHSEHYITSSNDKVINALRFFSFPEYEVLPANIDIPTPLFDLGHSLIETYLSESNSVKKYRNSINLELINFIGKYSSLMYNPNNNYGINYFIESYSNIPQSLKPILLDPNGKNVLCTNTEECTELGTPFFCGYDDHEKNTYCQVHLNSLFGTYSALQPPNNSWYLSVANEKQYTFYCYENIACIGNDEYGQCTNYSVNTIQSDPACHSLGTKDSYRFDYQAVLTQMFTNGYYRAFWIKN